MNKRPLALLASAATLIWAGLTLGAPPAAAQADLTVTECEALVELHEVRLTAEVCNNGPNATAGTVDFYVEPGTATGPGASPDENASFFTLGAGGCTNVSAPTGMIPSFYLPNGKYKLWCRVSGNASDPTATNNLAGPDDFVVGPDLWVYSFWVGKDGDTSVFKAVVCNTGTDTARKFRVGFYFDRTTAPQDGDYSDAFKPIEELQPAWHWWGDHFAPWLCEEVEYKRTPTPNDSYTTWCKVDDGLFVEEADEDNNVLGPYRYTMSNADLVIERFEARVSNAPPYTIYWDVTICNRGTATAGKFWADLYYDRAADDPPQLGEPGDDNYGAADSADWRSLPPNACVHHTFERYDVDETTPEHPEYETWLQVDADEFVYDPDRSTNLEGPLDIRVPGGAVESGCLDGDGDGYGAGDDCLGLPDCDDTNPDINPGAEEICGDGIDQDCNKTPDDGCAGVDCQDEDGDGWPSGPDCVVEDCDDTNPDINPGAEEICGDGIDQDCDGIPDDCCDGVNCCDEDGDGYGVGTDCPGGVQDCDDGNPAAGSAAAEEICGDNQDNDCDGLIDENCEGSFCTDEDDDGYGVGVGCIGIQDPDDTDPAIPADTETCGDGVDNDANGVVDDGCPGCNDFDGDGYGVGDDCAPGERDCNEQDASIHPGAEEVCDLVDNNCNHTVDEGTPGNACPEPGCAADCDGDQACIDACPTLNCIDEDGDGWGSGSGCQVEDCDDGDPNVHPGAAEVCDLVDNDCDGTADDSTPDDPCPNVECALACGGDQVCIDACPPQDCVDHDGDGWGVGADCAEQDPDDSDPATWPHAPEICGDGVDQSGDGVVDEGCVLCTDHDGDGYGVGPYCDVRDCNDMDPQIHPGATERCGDGDRNCDGIPYINSACESCNCRHAGGNPVGHWPTSTALLLALGLLLRWRRRGHG